MRILLTNDDGINAVGLWEMKKALESLGDITVIAPLTEQSGVSQQITYLSPLFCERWQQESEQESKQEQKQDAWVVHGTPSDCVKLGITELLPQKPELVVSGINSGLNTGINTHYSGTVAAAMEAAIFGVDAVAISLEHADTFDFVSAASIAINCISTYLDQDSGTSQLLNINIPTGTSVENAILKPTYMKQTRNLDRYIKREDPKNRTYYWSTDTPPAVEGHSASDVDAVHAGFVSITPLTIDRTNHETLSKMSQLRHHVEDSSSDI